jgi:hypothetical protein
MPRLHIALHDGFRGNHVTITVDGNVVYDRSGVATDLRISRADAVDVDVAATSVAVAVDVDAGAIAGAVTVDLSAAPYVAIDLMDGGKLRFTHSGEAFAYL